MMMITFLCPNPKQCHIWFADRKAMAKVDVLQLPSLASHLWRRVMNWFISNYPKCFQVFWNMPLRVDQLVMCKHFFMELPALNEIKALAIHCHYVITNNL
jgi:hypothetical protein